MATRSALLIASANSKYGFLPGAGTDVKRFSAFLHSDHGGAWEQSEIAILLDPTLIRQSPGRIGRPLLADNHFAAGKRQDV